MNITGAFELTVNNYVRAYGGTGAFWIDPNQKYTTNTTTVEKTEQYPYSTKFDASRSWTGETSKVGNDEPINVMQPFWACYAWIRIL